MPHIHTHHAPTLTPPAVTFLLSINIAFKSKHFHLCSLGNGQQCARLSSAVSDNSFLCRSLGHGNASVFVSNRAMNDEKWCIRFLLYTDEQFIAISNIRKIVAEICLFGFILVSSIVTTHTSTQWTDDNIVPGWDLIKFSYWFPFISFHSSSSSTRCILFLCACSKLFPAQLRLFYYYFSSISIYRSRFGFFFFRVVSVRLLSTANLCVCVCRFPYRTQRHNAPELMHEAETDSLVGRSVSFSQTCARASKHWDGRKNQVNSVHKSFIPSKRSYVSSERQTCVWCMQACLRRSTQYV